MPVKTSLLFLIFFLSLKISAQEYVFGKITNEDDVELREVTVINLNTDERSVSDQNGHYMIKASQGDELRFTKLGYERASQRLIKIHFEKPLNIALKQIPQEIEEVEIKYRVTGNLKEDSKHFGDRGKVKKMKDELASYVARKSDPMVLAPRHGEFVQPVGKGFSIGKIKNRWDDIDFMNFLMKEIDEKFFTEDLKLSKPEISSFIFFVLKGFERQEILKYGQPKSADIVRFMDASTRKIGDYQNRVSKK